MKASKIEVKVKFDEKRFMDDIGSFVKGCDMIETELIKETFSIKVDKISKENVVCDTKMFLIRDYITVGHK